jgi:SLT domain-containing protein
MYILETFADENLAASIMGASTQLRILGAVIGLAFANTALNNYTASHLGNILTSEQRLQLAASTKILSTLPPDRRWKRDKCIIRPSIYK